MKNEQNLPGFVRDITLVSSSNYKELLHFKYIRILTSMFGTCSAYSLNGGLFIVPFTAVDNQTGKIQFTFTGISNISLFKKCLTLNSGIYNPVVEENNRKNTVAITF